MKKFKGSKNVLQSQYGNHVILTAESFIVGILTGIVIVAFRKSIDIVSAKRILLYSWISHQHFIAVLIPISIACLFGISMGFLIKKYPIIKGSGVSQIKGRFMRKLALAAWPELPFKFIGGVISISSGLSVGREGPSVQIGAYVGSAFEKIGKQSHIEKVCLITSGAAAGLAATFGAPLAGVVFAIEDLHQYLSPRLLICVMAGAFAGDFVASLFFKPGTLFLFEGMSIFPLKYFGFLIILGMLTAIIGHLFKTAIYTSQKLYRKLHIRQSLRPLIPFLISVPVCLYLPFAASGGDHLIAALVEMNFSAHFLFIVLVAKIVFTGISAGSGAIGGIFVPLLSCGALVGILFSKGLAACNLINLDYSAHFMIYAMAGFFATVIKAPLTALILLIEISGGLPHLGAIILTVFSAYTTATLMNSPANDDVLLEQILAESASGSHPKKEADGEKHLFEIFVSHESAFAERRIAEINWPKNCLIVGLAKGEEEIIPDGNTKIAVGDRLIILADAPAVEAAIYEIGFPT